MKKQFKIVILICFSWFYLSFVTPEKYYTVSENTETNRTLSDVQYLKNKVKKIEKSSRRSNNSFTRFKFETTDKINELVLQNEKQQRLIQILSLLFAIEGTISMVFVGALVYAIFKTSYIFV